MDYCEREASCVFDVAGIKVLHNIRDRQRIVHLDGTDDMEEAVCVADHSTKAENVILNGRANGDLTHHPNGDAIVTIAEKGAISELRGRPVARFSFLVVAEVPTSTLIELDVTVFVVAAKHDADA